MESSKRQDEKTISRAELNRKLDGISEQLRGIQNLLVGLNNVQTQFLNLTARWIDDRRKEAGQEDRRLQLVLTYRSIILGLLIGILGNVFVSCFIKAMEIFGMSLWNWVIATTMIIVALFGAVYLILSRVEELLKISAEELNKMTKIWNTSKLS